MVDPVCRVCGEQIHNADAGQKSHDDCELTPATGDSSSTTEVDLS